MSTKEMISAHQLCTIEGVRRGVRVQTSSYEPGIESVDPRIVRTRRMLMDSLLDLLTRKDFADISIQEIASRATLNRATFYLHYPDKSALLSAMTDSRFRDLVARRGISFTDCEGALGAIALGVCDYFAETSICPGRVAQMPLEASIIAVVEGMFREGVEHRAMVQGADQDLVATTAAWAVFGAARRWFETPDRIPAEQMARRITALVRPIFVTASM